MAFTNPISTFNRHQAQSGGRSTLYLMTALSTLIAAIAFALSFLCIYAGHKPNFMEEYAIFTLNTSRIGENMLQNLDSKISKIHIDFKRSALPQPVVVEVAQVTAPPTTFIAVAPRDIAGEGFLSSKASQAESLVTKGTAAAASDISIGTSKIGSAASAAESAVNSGLSDIEQKIIAAVNSAYADVISDLKVKDFYSVHVKANCEGDYVFKNGTNITAGESGPPTKNGSAVVHERVSSCKRHSAFDPLDLITWLYWIAIICVGVTFVLAGCVVLSGCIDWISATKACFFGEIFALLAFLSVGFASAIVHGVSLAAAKVMDILGGWFGLAAYKGENFIALTWATTFLLLANGVLWFLMRKAAKKVKENSRDGPGRKDIMMQQREIPLSHLGAPPGGAGYGVGRPEGAPQWTGRRTESSFPSEDTEYVEVPVSGGYLEKRY